MDDVVVLENGKIPPYTECPFKNKCGQFKDGNCHHTGVEHIVFFSCGTARLFEILNK